MGNACQSSKSVSVTNREAILRANPDLRAQLTSKKNDDHFTYMNNRVKEGPFLDTFRGWTFKQLFSAKKPPGIVFFRFL